jgi:hypothetical protein
VSMAVSPPGRRAAVTRTRRSALRTR